MKYPRREHELLRCWIAIILLSFLTPTIFPRKLSLPKPQEKADREQRIGRIDDPPNTNQTIEDLSGGARFRFEIAPILPLFTFKIIPDVRYDQNGFPQSAVKDIEVFKGNIDQPLQHLTDCELSEMEPPPRTGDWFHTDDINFDGYQDIYLMTNWGATGNQHGCIWLYNPRTGKFDYSKAFSELSSYWLDSVSKTIRTFDKGGMAGLVYTAHQYKVEGDRPIMIWFEQQDWDSDKKQFHCVLKQRRSGAMVTTRDVWGDSGEAACELPLNWFQSRNAKKE